MYKLIFNFFTFFSISLLFVSHVYAAETTIGVSPNSGTFDKAFKANIVIDGKGDVFNAAESKVKISSNLTVKDIILGDCNFSYLSTPTTENLSFSGVILSGSSKKCTVYTMTLLPKEKGNASINLSDGSVRRYGDAVNVLKGMNNASFTLSGTVASAQTKAITTKETNGLYTLTINVVAKEHEPLQDALVSLTSPDIKSAVKIKTSASGQAQFTKLKEGVYEATVDKDNKIVARTIINVKGSNPNISFGINLENQKNNPLLGNTTINIFGLSPWHIAAILGVGIIFGAGIAFTTVKLSGRKKKE